jgi:antitoxin PrlF
VEIAAKLSSKGQLTVPKPIRDALGLSEGDDVLFRVDGRRAVLARTTDFLSLAGSVATPANRRNVAWDDVLRRTRATRGAERH